MAFTDIFRTNKLKRVLYETFFFNGTPLNEPRSFKNDLISGYLDNEVSYAVINKIAQTAASVPYKLVDKNDKEVKNHWILDLLNYPNPDNTFKEIYYAHIIYLYSIGNSYIYSPLLNENRRKSLWIVPAEEVSIIKGNYIEPIKGYKIYNGDNQIVMDKKDIFFNKLFNPRFNGGQWLYGLSPISVGEQAINTFNSGMEFLDYSYRNGGPKYAVTSKVPLNSEQKEQLLSLWKKKYSGPENANTPLISATDFEIHNLGGNIVDMAVLESNKEMLRTICNLYGVSSVLFNDNEQSTYNNVEQARKDFYEYTIKPLNTDFSEKFSKFLGDENVRLEFDYTNVEVLQDALYTKAQALNSMEFLDDNEKREIIGFDKRKEPLNDKNINNTDGNR